MDPVTHAVVGMAVSKIAGNPIALSEPVSMGIIIGSVFPDIDILLQKWGDCVYLKNHRAATHSIPGMVVSAIFIAGVLGVVYPGSSFLSIFIWSLAGCFSHTFFDLFNSYGARLLWPLCKKKFSLSLLVIFDPIIAGTLIGYIFVGSGSRYLFLYSLAVYLVLRVAMRFGITYEIKRKFGIGFDKISLLPSMTGLFRWHFILETADYNIVGEKNLLKQDVKILKRLRKLPDEAVEKVLYSPVGRFFSEFTPLFHVACEKTGEGTRYVFIDMRYYVRNKFLHHAVLEMDDNNAVVKQTFNPYSINRSNLISA